MGRHSTISLTGIKGNMHGDAVLPRPPRTVWEWMAATLDTKIKERLFGALIAGGPICILIGVYLLAGGMRYQAVVSDVDSLKDRVKALEEMKGQVNRLEVTGVGISKDVETIKNSQAEAKVDQTDLLKKVGDIRILLAQRGMQQPQP